MSRSTSKSGMVHGATSRWATRSPKACPGDTVVVAAERDRVAVSFEPGRVAAVVVGEDGGAGEEGSELGPIVGCYLLCKEGTAGREDAVNFGGVDRFVAAKDEVERGVAQRWAFGIAAQDGDAQGAQPVAGHGGVDDPLFGREE